MTPRKGHDPYGEPGEHCQDCGDAFGVVWSASDDLWQAVTGFTDGNGILCPRCFDRRAVERGIGLMKWVPQGLDAYKRGQAYQAEIAPHEDQP